MAIVAKPFTGTPDFIGNEKLLADRGIVLL
jgi:hypothetical protein